ncbi:DNA polymerase/3'-5' exonuclease PolX [Mangrovibacillus cuniculi]|uniref:DNA-directed DNA polymerase n=1 Tax=Mangrovibacillus cuniculi TaxID=2593652 RepID=A0A7S8CBX6_9BACI|nr:DNA polymerase/3'-5' exonuclease PolX [Mangrovibacillus cuniculi]QPC47170.1 DNA polymerase/3'-5' exonuclease PolX [Mangrovibacillus cuniculi]
MNKKEVIKHLESIAIYMELNGENAFKTSAFRKAAAALENDDRSLDMIDDVTKLSGIGKGTAAAINEFISTGTSSVLEELKEKTPKGLLPLLQLPGLGGKKIAKLYQELGITSMEQLKEACEQNRVQTLAGFGAKTEEKILAAIEKVGQRPDRYPYYAALPVATLIEEALQRMEDITRYSRAGSLRRVRETVKDLDFIIATNHPERVRDQLVKKLPVQEVIAAGDTKVSVVMEVEDVSISVDFRLVEPKAFITTLHHFTGSKDHNVRMRQLAKERDEKISEYGVEVLETGEVLTFETEEAFYEHFGLPFIPPEARESGKEVDEKLGEDKLIKLSDIRGDVHMHTTWSDGAYSIREMVEACRAKGYEYIAITDHSHYLKVANGLSPERLRAQMEEIRQLNEEFDDFHIFTGTEMDILPNGDLDFDEDLLSEVDFVIASIHSSFQQPVETIMERLKNALQNVHVDLIAHPTGRIVGKREGYSVDIDQLLQLAKETNTAVELNANPYRFDLNDEVLRKAKELGVSVMINTDAHDTTHLDFMELGVSIGKKGWLSKDNVINTKSKDEFQAYLNRHLT